MYETQVGPACKVTKHCRERVDKHIETAKRSRPKSYIRPEALQMHPTAGFAE